MNIFQKIKHEVDFLDMMTHYCGPLKEVGSDTWTTDDDTCPIHGGSGCFRMKVDGADSMVNCFGNCDHDEWPVDIIEFVRIKEGLETIGEAARLIAKDFKVKPDKESATTRILRSSEVYYRELFELGTKRQTCLGKRTPLAYQLDYRGHQRSTLDQANIGWSDGGLTDHLEDIFTEEEMIASGLVKTTEKGATVDSLPKNSFIYPHYHNGKLSRFTFKHSGNLSFQMKKIYWLNGVQF